MVLFTENVTIRLDSCGLGAVVPDFSESFCGIWNGQQAVLVIALAIVNGWLLPTVLMETGTMATEAFFFALFIQQSGRFSHNTIHCFAVYAKKDLT